MPRTPDGGWRLDDAPPSTYACLCGACRHRFPDRDGCTAFPGGIPDDIDELGFDHRRPYPGDGGIRFEPVDEISKDVDWRVDPHREPTVLP